MTKILIAGLATIIVVGTALVGTGMYAATNGTSLSGKFSKGMYGSHMNQGNPDAMITSLSGKVSPEAIVALQTLMARHTADMSTIRSNTGTTFDPTTMKTKMVGLKIEMDALMVQYPELKTALPGQFGKMNHGMSDMKGGKVNMGSILVTLPPAIQTEIKAIRDDYQAKQSALRSEQQTKINAILAPYPEVRAKFDAMQTGDPSEKKGKRDHNGWKNGDMRGAHMTPVK